MIFRRLGTQRQIRKHVCAFAIRFGSVLNACDIVYSHDFGIGDRCIRRVGDETVETACHLARLDPQYLPELIRRSPECSALILQTLNERVEAVQKYMLNLPSSRVKIVGSKFDDDCREIRNFLSMNRIPVAPAPAPAKVVGSDHTAIEIPCNVVTHADGLEIGPRTCGLSPYPQPRFLVTRGGQ